MVDLFDRSSSVDFKKDYEIRREEIRKEREEEAKKEIFDEEQLSAEELILDEEKGFFKKTGNYIAKEAKNIYNDTPESLLNKPVINFSLVKVL